ncbi:hypothetical protein GCM10011357_17860 [Lacimicrobium alkaliphilum]|uniref:Uncharacterized protein n=1 Tax=Lacimicrobium alkaliphilum TaxID=1526571 RepID=A0ABQ1R9K7_9ALTE|nr:hypothetical protein GCM10011357_17860 [Lacimicrobium alkaliphilum]
MSIKHGGFTSSETGNKGIREGLRLAKECIRSVDPCWVQVSSWEGLAEDQKQYLDNLLHQLQQHPPKAADALLNQQQRQAILSNLTTLKQDISSNASHTLDNQADTLKLTDIQTHKRQFINTISEKIKQTLIHFSDKDVEINTQLVSLQSLPAQQYLNSTQLPLEPASREVLQQALDNINAQQQLFNAQPGYKGVYELVGLNDAAEVIRQKLRTITNNQSQTKA